MALEAVSEKAEDWVRPGATTTFSHDGLPSECNISILRETASRVLQDMCLRELVLVLGLVDSLSELSPSNNSPTQSANSGGSGGNQKRVYPSMLQCLSSPNSPSPTLSNHHLSALSSHPISLLHPLAIEFCKSSSQVRQGQDFASHVLSRLLQRRFLTSSFSGQWTQCLRKFVSVLFSLASRFHEVIVSIDCDWLENHAERGISSDGTRARALARWLLHVPQLNSSHAPELTLLQLLLSCAASGGSIDNEENSFGLELMSPTEASTSEAEAVRLASLERERCLTSASRRVEGLMFCAVGCIPTDLGDAMSGGSEQTRCKRALLLCCCYQLQLIVQLLDMASSQKLRGLLRQRQSQTRRRAGSCDSGTGSGSDDDHGNSGDSEGGFTMYGEEQASLLNSISGALEKLSLREQTLVPHMALVVKVGLALSCTGATVPRYDFMDLALRIPLSIDSLAASFTSASGPGGVGSSSLPWVPWRAASQQAMLAELQRDSGYQHFHSLSRADAVAVLLHYAATERNAGRPQAAHGSFLGRPHDRHPDLLFLSMVSPGGEGGDSRSDSSAQPPSVTHAIIRRVSVTRLGSTTTIVAAAGSSGSTVHWPGAFEYKCGKVGPFPSLADMLAAISRVLPTASASVPVPGTSKSSEKRGALSVTASSSSSSSTQSSRGKGLNLAAPVPLPPFAAVPLPSYKGSGIMAAAAALFSLASCDPNSGLWEEAVKCGVGSVPINSSFNASISESTEGGTNKGRQTAPAAGPWEAPLDSTSQQSVVRAVTLLLSVQALQQESRAVCAALGIPTLNQAQQGGPLPLAVVASLNSLCVSALASSVAIITPPPHPTASFIPWLAPAGAVAAERAIGHLLASVPVLNVKLPGRGSGVGTAEYNAECLDPQEVLAWLSEREARLQAWLDAQVKEGHSQRRLVASATAAVTTTATVTATATASSTTTKTSVGGDDGPSGKGSSTSAGASLHMLLMLKEMVTSRLQDAIRPLDSSRPMFPTAPISGEQNQHLHQSMSPRSPSVDPTEFNPSDWAAAYASWLQENRTMYAVTKPPESAFTTSVVYYRHRDVWEGRAASTENKAGGLDDLDPIPGERCRLGRYFYTRPAVGDAPISKVQTAAGWGWGLRHLWDAVRGDAWVADLIGGALYSTAAPASPIPRSVLKLSPAPVPRLASSPYEYSLQLHLHRNLLFSRAGLASRFIAQVQCTLQGLKDVASVGGSTGAVSLLHFAPPSTMEVFMVCLLTRPTVQSGRRRTGPGGSVTAGGVNGSGTGSSSSIAARLAKVSDSAAATAASATLGTRLPPDGAYTGPTKRAEICKSANSGGGSGGGTEEVGSKRGNKQPGLGGGGGIEYRVRDIAAFRFPLPEGVARVSCPGADGSAPRSSCRAGRGLANRTEEEAWRGNMHCPPCSLHVTIYERTFLSENRLGELTMPLAALTQDSTLDEWMPLINERSRGSGAWLAHIQVELKYILMSIEAAQVAQNVNVTKTSTMPKTTSGIFEFF